MSALDGLKQKMSGLLGTKFQKCRDRCFRISNPTPDDEMVMLGL